MTITIALSFVAVAWALSGVMTILEFRRSEKLRSRYEDRIDELLGLLEARSAPQEYAAYFADSHNPDLEFWTFDETGLLSAPYEDDQ